MIPITIPLLGEEEAQAAAEAIRSGWVAQGPRVEEFEEVMASYLGVKHAVAVSSCTAALHLALVGLGIGPGDEVVVPSLSYVATANAVLYVGATPVFVDVQPRTFNMDPDALSTVLTPRTRAVVPVHQLGLAADLDPILELARQHDVAVIEDAACALGTTYRGQLVGTRSRMGCFSFHPRKIITTGEGGMLTTGDDDLARLLRVLRSQGMSVPADVRHDAGRVVFEEYRELGFNYRLTDIQGAIGLEQMKRLPGLLSRRRELARRYDRLLEPYDGVVTPLDPEPEGGHAYQSYKVLLEGDLSRVAVMARMLERGVSTRRSVQAIHLEPLYRELHAAPLPVTERIFARGLMLPLYPQMEQQDQDQVVAALAEAISGRRV